MTYYVIAKKRFTVAAIALIADDWRSQCPALRFLADAYADANTRASCLGYRALFEALAEHGPAGVTTAMMHEVDKNNGILELIKGRLRLFCYIERDMIYLMNGYLKSTQKADKAEVRAAIDMKNSYQKIGRLRSIK